LTTLRKEAGGSRTRLVNKIRQILRRHNLQWEMPTKTFPTVAAIAWLKGLVLPEIDRLEMNHLLTDLEQGGEALEGIGAGDRPARGLASSAPASGDPRIQSA
jgi:hypothetical protein